MPQSTTSLTVPSQNKAAPAEVFGALREGLHLAGYSFERAVQKLDHLLADDRWQQCGEFDGDVNKFLASISLADFRPTIDQRKSIVRKLAAIEASQRAIAKVVGVSQATVTTDLKDEQNRSPAQKKPNGTKGSDPPSEQNRSPTPTPDSGRAAVTRLAEKDKRPRPDNFVALDDEISQTTVRDMRAVHSKLTDDPRRLCSVAGSDQPAFQENRPICDGIAVKRPTARPRETVNLAASVVPTIEKLQSPVNVFRKLCGLSDRLAEAEKAQAVCRHLLSAHVFRPTDRSNHYALSRHLSSFTLGQLDCEHPTVSDHSQRWIKFEQNGPCSSQDHFNASLMFFLSRL